MAGGTFTSQNKQRPGVYVNFTSGRKQLGVNANGTIAMTMALDWGRPNEFIDVTSQTNLLYGIGRTIEEQEVFLLKEALKTSQKVLLFNVAGTGSSQATGTLNDKIQIMATKSGKTGNEIKIVIDEELDSAFTVYTYFKNTLVDKQVNLNATDIVENDYVVFSGEGELEETAGITLSGGVTQAATNDNYIEFFKALETRDFYAFCLDTDDDTIKQTAVNYTKKWRDQEGKKVIFVTANVAADYEGVTNVSNGVVLESGRVLSALDATPAIAGAMASVGIQQSLTYFKYPGAVDANPRMSQSDVEDALQKGKFIFTYISEDRVVVEQDINSLRSFSDVKNKDFRKNKIVRVIDAINNELMNLYSNSYIGEISNNIDGRELLKKDILALLDDLKQKNALNEYASEDVNVTIGNDKDVVLVELAISVADAMEKLYVTVTLN